MDYRTARGGGRAHGKRRDGVVVLTEPEPLQAAWAVLVKGRLRVFSRSLRLVHKRRDQGPLPPRPHDRSGWARVNDADTPEVVRARPSCFVVCFSMSFVLPFFLVAESIARTTFPLHGGASGGHPAVSCQTQCDWGSRIHSFPSGGMRPVALSCSQRGRSHRQGQGD